MNITIVKFIPFPKLQEQIRQVSLKELMIDKSPNHIYKNARILLRDMHPDELNPGSKYILQPQLELQEQLRKVLLQDHGIDILNLEGGYVLRNDDTNELWTLIPPIVEVTEESMTYQDTRGDVKYTEPTTVRMNVIVDGLHRLHLARFMDKMCKVIHIDGIPKEYPFYALPNRWNEVKIYQTTPEGQEKKNYRRTNNYGLYRDFEILGCGAPRNSQK